MSRSSGDEFTALLGALVGAGVGFVVIGGWALPVHGAGRTTFDELSPGLRWPHG